MRTKTTQKNKIKGFLIPWLITAKAAGYAVLLWMIGANSDSGIYSVSVESFTP